MAVVAERQSIAHEDFGRMTAHFDELGACELLQDRARSLDPSEIAPDDAGINLADHCDRLTSAMIASSIFFEALVSATETECRKVRKVHAQTSEQMRE